MEVFETSIGDATEDGFGGHEDIVSCVCVSGDEGRVVRGSFDKTLRRLDMSTGNTIEAKITVELYTFGEDAVARFGPMLSEPATTPLSVTVKPISGRRGQVTTV